jgi:hypothetical protein
MHTAFFELFTAVLSQPVIYGKISCDLQKCMISRGPAIFRMNGQSDQYGKKPIIGSSSIYKGTGG